MPPQFDGAHGIDGREYADTPDGKALRIRHATFWEALTTMGLSSALLPRRARPLMAKNWFGWEPLGDYTGLTNTVVFEGPITQAHLALLTRHQARPARRWTVTRPSPWSPVVGGPPPPPSKDD